MKKNTKKEKHEWERQAGEPDKCWLLFQSFVQPGPRRTVTKRNRYASLNLDFGREK